MNFVKLIFGHPESGRRSKKPQPSGSRNGDGTVHPQHEVVSDDDPVGLAVAKAIGQLSFIARSYAFDLCEASVDDLRADLETMLRYQDLANIRLELIGAGRKVLFEFLLNFDGTDRSRGRLADTGRGIELPMLDRSLVAGRRLIVRRRGLESRYKDKLRLPWSNAPTIAKAAGTAYESEHAAKISGGRQSAAFYVADVARHRFVIIQTGTKGFGFAKDLDTGREWVFVLAKQLPDDIEFRVGARFTAVLVPTPRGLQVRSARSA